jgi:hypothetical protein
MHAKYRDIKSGHSDIREAYSTSVLSKREETRGSSGHRRVLSTEYNAMPL